MVTVPVSATSSVSVEWKRVPPKVAVPVLATSSVMVSVEWEMVHPQGDCTCVGYFQCDGECGVGDGSPPRWLYLCWLLPM